MAECKDAGGTPPCPASSAKRSFGDGSPARHAARPRLIPSVVAILAVYVLLVSQWAPLTGKISALRARALRAREGHHLVFWAPMKTGSSSMRTWLRLVARQMGWLQTNGPFYLFADVTDWANMTHEPVVVRNASCSVNNGHIRVRAVHERFDELALGAVITTMRGALGQLASTYFYKLKRSAAVDVPSMTTVHAPASQIWFYFWDVFDPCMFLRYYDGLPGCDLAVLSARIESIAARIDCVVDADDPAPDLRALCAVMHVSECPDSQKRKVVATGELYAQLFAVPFLREAVAEAEHVLTLLNEALSKRRCRFLVGKSRHLWTPGWEAPAFPYAGCQNGSAM